MISTLQDLITPLPEAEFVAHLRDRKVAFVRSSEPHRFETLLNWDELNYLIESGLYPIEELRVRASTPIASSFYIKQGRIDPAALSSLMDRGAGLIFNRFDKYVPRLCRLCHQIAEQTGEQVTAEAIVTSKTDGARRHVNKQDMFVLQLAGSSRWELCSPSNVSPLEDTSGLQGAPVFDEMLRVGDFLFVPAGYLQRCEYGPGRSLNVCIVLEPPSGRDVLNWLISQLMTDETFNQPLTRSADGAALASHEAALKARLIQQVQVWSLADFLAERAAARSKEVVIRIQGT